MPIAYAQSHRFDSGVPYDYDRSYGRAHARGRGSPVDQQAPQARESATSLRARSQTNLTVVTAEGDRITISLAAQTKLDATSHAGPDGSTQTLSSSTSSKLRVKVEGNLSDDELKDLGALIDAVGNATKQAEQTGTADAAALSTTLAGLDSLASFDYAYRESVQVGTRFRAIG